MIWLGLVTFTTHFAGLIGGAADTALESTHMTLEGDVIEQVVEIPVALVAEVEARAVETCLESAELALLRGHVEEEVVSLVASVAVPQRVAVQALKKITYFTGRIDRDGRVVRVQEEVSGLVACVADRAVLGAVETACQTCSAGNASVTDREVPPVALQALVDSNAFVAQNTKLVEISTGFAELD